MWKQRDLTIFGKNIILSTFINSQVLFNSQIEVPPHEFLKMVENIKKSFLWSGGSPKIAHHSLIGKLQEGGIGYKDLQTQIKTLNTKFVLTLHKCKSSRKFLPCSWIFDMFRRSSNINDNDLEYYKTFTENSVEIVSQCCFKLPNKSKFKGHPFYYDCLKTIQEVNKTLPESINELLSVPLWYNKYLNSQFDCILSKNGFNFIKTRPEVSEVDPQK